MIEKYKKLPLAWQINIFICAAIILLSTVAGYVSVHQSSKALLGGQLEALHKNVETATELISTPYQSLLPIVGSMAQNLGREFSGNFVSSTAQMVDVAGNRVPSMSIDGQLITNNFEKVDAFTVKWGAAATIFQRVNDDFLRVSTSLKKADDSRAFGTWLGKTHPGYQTLMNGNPYTGYANLFGRHYITQYDPVVQSGRVVAILFVGVDVSETVNGAFDAISNITIGETGYLFIVNSKGKVVMHPTLEAGYDFNQLEAADGSKPFAYMVEQQEGNMRYLWDYPKGATGYKYTAFEYSEDWKWIIAGGTFEDEFTQAADSMAILLTFIYVIGSAIVLIIGFWIAKQLIKPLYDLAQKIHVIGQGELVQHGLNPPIPDSNNEVHSIENSMHNMVASLRTLVQEILSIGDNVQTISQDVCANSNEQQQTSSQLSQEADMGATAIEQLSMSFREVAQNVNNAASSAKDIDYSSNESSNHMTTLLNSTESMAARIGDVDGSISELSDNVQNIKNAVELIRGIAEQTNLLALNAAIEAARAGEQGRGFAVVADEVRNLAQRTQGSTNEIEQVVESFLAATDNSKQNMQQTLAETQVTRDKAVESADLLANMSGMITNMNQELESIASAVTEQSTISNDIAKRQVDVSQIATDSSDKAQQALDSSNKLNELAEKLTDSLSNFNA